MSDLSERLVVVTGATGLAGRATVRRLLADGARVVGAGSSEARLEALATDLGSLADRFDRDVVDLREEMATRAWAADVRARHPSIDGIAHLVGGWRGSDSFPAISMTDAGWLHDQLVRSLQHVSLAFHDDLVRSGDGRFAIISAAAVDRPTAASAAYASAKAAAEAWMKSLADSFAHGVVSEPAAAVTFVVRFLAPHDQPSPGATPVDQVAQAIATLWDTDSAFLNGARITLYP